MVLKFKFGNGGEFHGPPYTKQEEAELYRQMATGPTAMHLRSVKYSGPQQSSQGRKRNPSQPASPPKDE
jgi:hypothetical protein